MSFDQWERRRSRRFGGSRRAPGAERGSGSAEPLSSARAAGMRLSRTSAVLPAPDGPASAVKRCSGKVAVRLRRLYKASISIEICPSGAAAPGGGPGHGRGARQERAHD